jgi:hypothetical protein
MCRGGKGGTPTGVILSAVDGKIITTLPLALAVEWHGTKIVRKMT